MPTLSSMRKKILSLESAGAARSEPGVGRGISEAIEITGRLMSYIDELAAKVGSQDSFLHNLETRNDELEKKLTDTEDRLADAEERVTTANDRLNATQKELEQKSSDFADLSRTHNRLKFMSRSATEAVETALTSMLYEEIIDTVLFDGPDEETPELFNSETHAVTLSRESEEESLANVITASHALQAETGKLTDDARRVADGVTILHGMLKILDGHVLDRGAVSRDAPDHTAIFTRLPAETDDDLTTLSQEQRWPEDDDPDLEPVPFLPPTDTDWEEVWRQEGLLDF